MIRDSLAKFFKVDSLISNLTGYVETRVELLKLEAKEEISKQASNAIVYGTVLFLFTLVLVFFSVAIALTIGEHLGNFAGFSIVAGFYLIIGVVVLLNREKLLKSIEQKIALKLKKKNV
ncbi:MAG TPA: phage holin family protein [Chryseosolibacter sp.]